MTVGRAAILAAAVLAAPAANAQSIEEMMLSAAARECRPSEVSQLIRKGADVNSTNSGGYTPLMLAAGNGCLEAVRVLVGAGADITIAHASFGNAAAQAKMNGHSDVQAVLEGGATAASAASAGVQSAQPKAASAPQEGGRTAAAEDGQTGWPAIGAYRVGQEVLYSGSGGKTWQKGTIKAVDPKYGYSFVDGPSGSYSNYFVVAPHREPFWTNYFIGDWRVSVPMATGVVTDGRNVYRTLSGGLRLPPLRIAADGTYSWRVQEGAGEKVIRGRWEANTGGPGVILKNGEQGADWLVYNNTDALSTLGQTVIISSECCTHYDGSRIE